MPGIIYLAIPVFLGFISLELLFMRLRHKAGRKDFVGYERSDAAASLTMGVGNLVVTAAWKTVSLGVLYAVYQFRFFELDKTVWWYWAVLVIGEDFFYYWFHRFGHRTRMGWAGHVNHHSSTYFNYSTALRQSWTSPFFYTWFLIPLVLLGFDPLTIVLAHAVNLLYQFWVHTELVGKMPRWFEAVMNTPSHHRVHHGANDEYVDKNYAGIFIVWDRLFGTFQPEKDQVVYGLRKEFTSRNPLWIAFHEWIALMKHVGAARRWKNKLLYFIMPPAWDPQDEAEMHLQSAENSQIVRNTE